MSRISGTTPNVPEYVEDGNSPFTATNTTSKQFTVAGDYDHFVILPSGENPGFNALRVNGDTTTNYSHTIVDGTTTFNADKIPLGSFTQSVREIAIQSNQALGKLGVTVEMARARSDFVVAAGNGNVGPSIDSFTLLDTGNNARSVKLRGYGITL